MKPETVQLLGQHLIAEFYDAGQLLDDKPAEAALRQAAHDAGATVLDIRSHDFGVRAGFTAFAMLAESHISVHTWPEHDYAAIDIFLCGANDPKRALPALERHFRPGEVRTTLLPRGIGITQLA